MDENTCIYYLGYGSNLNRQRFLCYIQGGTPSYGKKRNRGCTDTTPPTDDRPFLIPYRLYFALPAGFEGTENWGKGGVAFISPVPVKEEAEGLEPTETEGLNRELTHGRAWKITRAQYEEIREQEGRGLYDLELKVGAIEGIPVYTITHSTLLPRILPPSTAYLKTIAEGLKETFHLRAEEIADYLLGKEGVKGYLTERRVREIIGD